MQDKLQWQRSTAPPITIGDTVLTAEAQALRVRFPWGGVVWNRPTAVVVERDGRQERMPIVDVTRQAQGALFGLSALFTLVAILITLRRRQDNGK